MQVLDVEVSAVVPERSYLQRMDALHKANDVRSRRAELKRRMKRWQVSGVDVVLAPAPYLETMKAFDLLVAMPKIGRVKASKLLAQSKMSPSKTLGGMSERQRRELAALLRRR